MYSNKVTTVSPIYAADLLTEEHGYDLHMALNKHKYVQFLIFNSKNGRNQHLQFSRLQKP